MRALITGANRGLGLEVARQLAALGYEVLAGAISWDRARQLTDRDGVALADVVAGGTSSLLSSVGTFVELHVEQGRDLVDRGAAVGVASEIWPHGRYRFEFAGAANHAGTRLPRVVS